jgi:2Fe-2S ferredoxin
VSVEGSPEGGDVRLVPEPTEVALPCVTFVDQAGDTIAVSGLVGDSVMQTAKRHQIPGIRGDCGGFMMCATCHVYVYEQDLDGLPPISDLEDEMLDGTASERLSCSRLSCQLPIEPDTDLRARLPGRQL